jgi:hypothetical protein
VIKVYSNEDRFLVQQIKDMLESKGISCFIKNEFAIGGAGDLSPFDCWPEVWIIDDDWQTKAEQMILDVKSDPQHGRDWYCSECGEVNAGSFGICWRCGAQAPQNE